MAEKRTENSDRQRLAAEFFSNIGVAWFAAGVIGIFIGGPKTFSDILLSLFWGISLSFIFLRIGSGFLKV